MPALTGVAAIHCGIHFACWGGLFVMIEKPRTPPRYWSRIADELVAMNCFSIRILCDKYSAGEIDLEELHTQCAFDLLVQLQIVTEDLKAVTDPKETGGNN